MNYRSILTAVLVTAITAVSATGAMAQNPSKEHRKPADTGRKAPVHTATPAPKPGFKADTAKKPVKKHL
ncbi:hypothetical protein [Chitinophaga vietnamensis]|uniref:hypothetical protein n=1 Tax=Chitinophaga vietnamensis TaxID=2593957 RepID=UPI0011776897|nr:hypothetical protein [Chitinophaga vietnamensis]